MKLNLKKIDGKKTGIFAAGVLFGTAGIKIPAVLLFFRHCYHGFQDNTPIKQAREAKDKTVSSSRIVVKMLSNRVKRYKAV